MALATIPEVIEEMRNGRMIILVDDEDRENEGDLCVAAEHITPDAINFMSKFGRGLVCLAMTEERADVLDLQPMVADNTSRFGTAFTVSIEARQGVTTGISAHDRATTVQVAVNENATSADLARPGHIFPLRAVRGGVLRRTGQTEGSVDLCRLAGLKPMAVICEVMKDDGTMARLPDLKEFAAEHNMLICSIVDIIEWRMKTEVHVRCIAEAHIPTLYGGEFRAMVFVSDVEAGELEHVALVKGDVQTEEPILARVHSSCLTGDVFGSLRCDCGSQLHRAMEMVNDEGRGVILYMNQEGRGIGLGNKIKAYALQEQGRDTVQANEDLGFKADLRDYGVGAQILVSLGIKNIRLLTNNPRKVIGLSGYGLNIADRVPIEVGYTKENITYMRTKKEKLGHELHEVDNCCEEDSNEGH
ncbi:MAG: bifunctional 3,4-dihydroxy-2-butanone-4-phosphate synthase/GTP cyclohydrolase II [Candidatus Lernaella stagnicola]|nr:bifunctional 3,4-dihydroxy-2-butanone-4-phosphate synthase/GTP cyclohydrolase II [Candidatus Lernaella stagnicola]